MGNRETFSSRLGFILISAGCAIGLGNVWRFPYITGLYGGAAFVLIYILFLVIMGLPIMTMELSVGRASRKSAVKSFNVLEPKGTKWHIYGPIATIGNYILMMFYTTISGWMSYYFFKMLRGDFVGLNAEQVANEFVVMTQKPVLMLFWMVLTVVICLFICSMGLRNGVEKITKVMMSSLFFIMIVLVIRAVTLPNAKEGLEFYLKPDFSKMIENGAGKAIFAAMGQAFFTLSIGMGAIAIFGSYIGKERALTGEAVSITLLDTLVALMSGLIIFPSASSFGIETGSGPSLVFITLPNIFNSMSAGRIWGTLFFLFMTFAAFSTVIAVFENLIASCMDLWGWDRKKSVIFNLIIITIFSIPCILGFNVLSGIQPLGEGTGIMNLEDFIVSNNVLPLGSLIYLMFCTRKYGWGWENFLKEANTGEGMKFPTFAKKYIFYGLPAIVLFIFVMGYIQMFFKK